jgi:hypothetical protein
VHDPIGFGGLHWAGEIERGRFSILDGELGGLVNVLLKDPWQKIYLVQIQMYRELQ